MNKHKAFKALICLGLAGLFQGTAPAQEPTGQDDIMPPLPKAVFGSDDVNDNRVLPSAVPAASAEPSDGRNSGSPSEETRSLEPIERRQAAQPDPPKALRLDRREDSRETGSNSQNRAGAAAQKPDADPSARRQASGRAAVPPQEPAAQHRPGTHSRDSVRGMQNRAGADADAAHNSEAVPAGRRQDADRAAESEPGRPAMRRSGTHSRDSVRGMQSSADADADAAHNSEAVPAGRRQDADRAAESEPGRPAMRRSGTHSRDSVRGMGRAEEPSANAGVSSDVSDRAEAPDNGQNSQAVRPRGTRPGKTVRGYTGHSVQPKPAAPAQAETAVKMQEPRQVAPGQYGEDLGAIVAEELRSLGKRHE